MSNGKGRPSVELGIDLLDRVNRVFSEAKTQSVKRQADFVVYRDAQC